MGLQNPDYIEIVYSPEQQGEEKNSKQPQKWFW